MVTKLSLIQAIEAAHASMFEQCCSNPITNAWGKPVSLTALNEAQELALRARREVDVPEEATPAAPSAAMKVDEIEQIIDEYVDDYELHGENEAGMSGVHTPTETERYMLKDAILGLLAHTEWDETWGRLIDARVAAIALPAPEQVVAKPFAWVPVAMNSRDEPVVLWHLATESAWVKTRDLDPTPHEIVALYRAAPVQQDALRRLVDRVWGHAYEDVSVPDTRIADKLIAEWREEMAQR